MPSFLYHNVHIKSEDEIEKFLSSQPDTKGDTIFVFTKPDNEGKKQGTGYQYIQNKKQWVCAVTEEYKDNKLHGLSVSHFPEHGIIKTNYKNNTIDGLQERYREDGALQELVMFFQGGKDTKANEKIKSTLQMIQFGDTLKSLVDKRSVEEKAAAQRAKVLRKCGISINADN